MEMDERGFCSNGPLRAELPFVGVFGAKRNIDKNVFELPRRNDRTETFGFFPSAAHMDKELPFLQQFLHRSKGKVGRVNQKNLLCRHYVLPYHSNRGIGNRQIAERIFYFVKSKLRGAVFVSASSKHVVDNKLGLIRGDFFSRFLVEHVEKIRQDFVR